VKLLLLFYSSGGLPANLLQFTDSDLQIYISLSHTVLCGPSNKLIVCCGSCEPRVSHPLR